MLNNLLSPRLNALVNEHVPVLLLRLGAGILILTHGLPKVMKVLQGDMAFGDPIGLGPGFSLVLSALAEGIGGLLVVLGLGTRIASIFLIINMAVAFFFFHAADPFGAKELPLFFLIAFITIFLTGGGKYSLDNKLFNEQA